MCNAIVGNFCRCKKKKRERGGQAGKQASEQARRDNFRSRLVVATTSRSLARTHLRCTGGRKARSTRAANANPISENNFSRGRILARLFKTSDLTPARAAAHPLRRPLYSVLLPRRQPPLSCSAPVVPAHFLRATFKPRSFLAIKECPRSFAVTYGRAGNNDKR